MSTTTRVSSVGSRLVSHVREPMHRSAYALVLGSAATSGFGYLFWVVAARHFDPSTVGTGTSMIAAMVFLANVSTLGLRGGLVRFLPAAGTRASRLIGRSYLLCGAVAACAAVIFLLGLPLWAPELGLLTSNLAMSVVFVCATVGWVGMVLQEHVLIGLHRASWVPMTNLAYSGVKIALIAAIGGSAWLIFSAYALPAIAVVVAGNALLARARRKSVAARPTVADPPLSGLVRFAAGDHMAAMLWLGTVELMPLVVLGTVGPAASAYYYLAFTAGYTLFLIMSNVGNAFVAEASREGADVAALARRATRHGLLLVVPLVVIGIALAPLVLRVLGPAYVNAATDLLRLVLLAAIPQIVIAIGTSVARVRRKISRVVVIYGVRAGLVLGGAVFALHVAGLTGVGLVWLSAQTLIALVLLLTQLSFLWTKPVAAAVIRVGSATRRGLRNLRQRRQTPRILAAVTSTVGRTLSGHTMLASDNDTLVAAAVCDGRDVVLKVARTPRASEVVARHVSALQAIGRASALATSAGTLFPALVGHGEVDGRRYLLESRLTGTPLSRDGVAAGSVPGVTADVARAVDDLHRATAKPSVGSGSLLEGLLYAPLDRIAELPGISRHSEPLAVVRTAVESALNRRSLVTAWTHGDLWLGNVLADRSAEQVRISGFIDWEDARPNGLPDMDLAHLWLTAQGGDLGQRVVDALARDGRDFDDWLETNGISRPNPNLEARVVLTLAWLSHVNSGIRRQPPHGPGRVWQRQTVDTVLPRVAEMVGPAQVGTLTEERPTEAPAPRRTEPDVGRRRRLRRVRKAAADVRLYTALALPASAVLWVAGLWQADPRRMTDLGLVSLLRWPNYVALAVLLCSFFYAVRRHARERFLGAHVLTLILLLQVTPPALFGTLRYSWAWKHIGIIDYIFRHGRVDTTIDYLGVYHDWPGFFGGSALLSDLAGKDHLLAIATWSTVFFDIATLLALRFVFRSFKTSRTRMWLALLLYFITMWVGQDYFSPQAFAYVLFLVVIGLVLRYFRRQPEKPAGVLAKRRPVAAFLLIATLIVAIAISHQITPIALTLALLVLFVGRQTRGWYLPVMAGGAMLAWCATVARPFVSANVREIIKQIASPLGNFTGTLDQSNDIRGHQVLVSLAGRDVIIVLGVVALAGLIVLAYRKRLDMAALLLMAAPGLMLFLTAFGGELLFRVFLFAGPFMCYFAAAAIADHDFTSHSIRKVWHRTVPALALCLSAALLAGFLLAYYGKDQQNYFTPGEVAASRWVADHSVPHTLLIRGNTNYPRDFHNYENFYPVTITEEGDWREILAHPDKLAGWMADGRYPKAYILLTRSQIIFNNSVGTMPPGSLQHLESSLDRSLLFDVVYRNRDAVVFGLGVH